MAGERTVSWKAVANFSAIARESKNARQELEKLKAAQASFNAAQSEETAALNKSTAATNKAVTAKKNLAAATRDELAAARALTSGIRAEADAKNRANTSTRSAITSKNNLAKANERELASNQGIIDANKAEIAQKRALNTVLNRAAVTKAILAQSSARQARAVRDEATATTMLANAQRKQVDAMRDSERATKSTAAGFDALARTQERLARTRFSSNSTELVNSGRAARSAGREFAESTRSIDRYGNSVRRAGRDSRGAGDDIGRVRTALAAARPEFKDNTRSLLRYGAVLRALGIPLVITGINLLISSLGPLSAAFLGLAGAIGPVAGLLGTLPGLFAAAAGGIGVLVGGFSGIGSALKEYGNQQKDATKRTAQAADAQKDYVRAQRAAKKAADDNARAVSDAQRSIKDAQDAAKRSSEDNARSIADAQRAVKDAQDDAKRSAEDNARSVIDAQRGVAAAQDDAKERAIDAVRAIQDAERNIADAQENAADAQRNLSEARSTARDEIERLRRSLKDLALDEEGASLSLEEAQERMIRVNNDPNATSLDRRQAAYGVETAQANLKNVRRDRSETSAELGEAESRGVEGSDGVVQAKRALRDANRDVASSLQALKDAQQAQRKSAVESNQAIANSLRSLQDAQRNQRQDAIDSNRAISDSIRARGDAQRNAAEDAANSERAISDAQRNLSDALRNQRDDALNSADALDKSATAAANGGQAVDKFAEEMAKLTPEARAVVEQLIRMKPLLDALRATAQRGMLPGVLSFLQDSVKLFGPVNRFVDKAAHSFGEFFTQVGNAMTTDSAIKRWGRIFDSTNNVIDSFLDAGFNIAVVIGNILDAGRPLTEWLANTFEGWTDSWKAMTSGEEGQKNTVEFFEKARRTAEVLGRVVGGIAGVLYNLGRGTQDLGFWILDSFGNMLEGWNEFLGSVEGQSALKKWAEDSKPALKALADLIGAFAQGIADLAGKTDMAAIFKQIQDELLPALLTVFGLFTGEAAGHIVSILSGIGEFIGVLAGSEGGALNGFLESMDSLINKMVWLAQNVPGIATILQGLVAFMAAKTAVNVLGSLTGVKSLTRTVGRYRKGRREQEERRGPFAGSTNAERKQTKTRNESMASRSGTGLSGGARSGGFVGRRADREVRAKASGSGPQGARRAAPTADSKTGARRAATGGRGVGGNVISGFAGGISARAKSAVSAMLAAVNSVIAAAKSRLGIKSPSTVFIRIGQQIAAGLIQGMRSMQGQVSAAASGLAGGAALAGAGGAGVVSKGGKKGKGGKKTPVAAQKTPKSRKATPGGGGGGKAGAAGDALTGAAVAASMLPGPLGSIASMLLTVMSVVSLFMPLLGKLGGAFLRFLPIIGRVILGFARFIPGIGIIVTVLAIAIPLIIKHWNKIKSVFFTVIDAIVGFVKTQWARFGPLIMGPFNAVIAGAKWFGKTFWSLLKVTFAIILAFVKVGWGLFQIFVLRPIIGIAKAVGGLIAAFGRLLMAGLRAVLASAKFVWSVFKKYILDPVLAVNSAIVGLMAKFLGAVSRGIKAVVDWVKNNWKAISGIILGPFQPILTRVGEFLGRIKDKFTDFVERVKAALKPLGTVFTDAFAKIKKAVSDPIGTVITVINKGIIGPYRSLAEKFGIKTDIADITYAPPAFKDGGRIPGGKQATRDNVLGVSRSGQAVARVEPGEFIMPRSKSQYFPMLEAIRRGKDVPGYKRGGLLPQNGMPPKLTNDELVPPTASQMKSLPVSVKGMPGNLRRLNKNGPGSRDLRGVGALASPQSDASGSRRGAASVASSMVGDMGWYRRCLAFVNKAWGYTVGRFGKATARDSMNAGPLTKSRPAPAGAAEYWDTGWAGHVALAMGDGSTVSNDIRQAGRLDRVPSREIDKWGPYRGWWHPNNVPGGKSNGSSDGGIFNKIKEVASNLPNPMEFLRGAYDKLKGGLSDLGSGEFGSIVKNMPAKLYDAAKAKAKSAFVDTNPVSDGISNVVSDISSKIGGSGRAAAREVGLKLGASSVGTYPGHQPSMNKAWDFMATGATGQRIADHLAANRDKYNIQYLIWNRRMLRDYSKGNIKAGQWAPYFDGQSSNPNRAHTNHVHASFYARGTNSAKRGPAVVGENGPELVYMNGGERVVNNNLTRRELPKYHAGGVVRGMAPGAKGNWVSALNSQMFRGTSSTWTSGLTAALKKGIPGVNTYNAAASTVKGLYNLIKRSKKITSIQSLASQAKMDPSRAWRAMGEVMAYAKKNPYSKDKKANAAKTKAVSTATNNFQRSRGTWVKSLETKLGVKADGAWDSGLKAPLSHVVAHALKQPHGILPHPWDKGKVDARGYTTAENQALSIQKIIDEQKRSNSLNSEYDGLISKFTGWTFMNIVKKMQEVGVADGLTLGRTLSKNKTLAGQYNTELGKQYARDDSAEGDQEKIRLLISTVNSGTNVGLQQAASALSMSLDSTSRIYDVVQNQKLWGDTPTSKRTRLDRDVTDFKKLFKFWRGGEVPGFQSGGSVPGYGNGDRVRALLEPGEFVVRKAAVSALRQRFGPDVMSSINDADRYRMGGFVAGGFNAPSVGGTSVRYTGGGTSTSSASNTNTSSQVTYQFNTEINNPTLEDGAVSIQKHVTSVARKGLLETGMHR